MRYTLEIQKLLLQTQNNNLHPREKANLLKEAIRIADENEDVEWATELRLDLIYELNLLSADAEEITVFSKILDDYENHKDVWQTLQQRGMTGDYSWTNSSKKYMELYEGLVSGRFDHDSASNQEKASSDDDAEANPVVVPYPYEKEEPEAPVKPKRVRRTKEQIAADKAAKEAAKAAEAPAKPARKRRTKAEIEADKAAKEAAKADKPARKPRAKKTETQE